MSAANERAAVLESTLDRLWRERRGLLIPEIAALRAFLTAVGVDHAKQTALTGDYQGQRIVLYILPPSDALPCGYYGRFDNSYFHVLVVISPTDLRGALGELK